MCGIAGIFHLDGRATDRDTLHRMTKILAHRGPDGQGLHQQDGIGFGHRRLSIVDLSEQGTQPMTNEDGSIWLTYNGEIYNHLDLHPELEAKGHRFQSKTDTEVLIHGYEEYGIDVLHQLNGMFAFALYDANHKRLWLARDRIGIKPLFYGVFENTLLFGSEVKAILEHPAARRELDHEALDLFLSLNYTPAPYTLFKHIRQLMPGEQLVVQAGNIHLSTYWDIDYSQPQITDEQIAQQEFERLFHDAVNKRLMADVPLGAFLSGGVDSSAVVSSMTRHMPQEMVKTFSMGFAEASFNEAPYAKEVAQHLKTQHYQKTVTPDLADILPQIVWHGEDPLADSSMVPVYYLSKMTREHVTVALAGDGADEILAGYPTYLATQWAKPLSFLPHHLTQKALAPLSTLIPISDEKISRPEKLQRFLQGVGLPWQEAHAVWRQIHTAKQKQAVLHPDVFRHSKLFETYHTYYAKSRTNNMLDALLYVDTRFYLPNDMLVKVDRMTMAHGLEARVPFLDHEFVQFSAQLAPNLKLNGRVGKYILRQIMKSRLPTTTLTRKKEGFNIPVSKWLREDLADLLHDTLNPTALNHAGVWQPKTIETMLHKHHHKQADYGYQLWGILTFMLWWEKFV